MNIIDEISLNDSNITFRKTKNIELSFFREKILDYFKFPEELDNLDNETIDKLSKLISGTLKSSFASIMYKTIKDIVPKDYLNLDESHIRPSLQPKAIWPIENSNYMRKTFIDKNGFMHEKVGEYNFCFPTRPHQDLCNNGFRSSHVLIFYFQLTDVTNKTSDLEVADFSGKKGLLEFSNKWGYYNQLVDDIDEKLNWYKPRDLVPGNVLVMDSFTIHRSSLKSSSPRLAINAKIHPEQLGYLFNIEQKKYFKTKAKSPINVQLENLRNMIEERAKFDNQIKFELAIINFLIDSRTKAYELIEEICLFKCSEKDIQKIITGAFIKKTLNQISKEDIESVIKDKTWVKNSCVDTIFNTLN